MHKVRGARPSIDRQGHSVLTERELNDWGERFGLAVSAPLVVTLSGDLGAGKTTLAKAICRGAGVEDQVLSPTYALVHEYHGARFPVYHLDLYRLEKASEMTGIGWDDILATESLVLVEWPERASRFIPPGAVKIQLEHMPGDLERRLLLAG
ncbi:MAG: tRNA (adenosine(37)-N6)-threonylcarbamoyltransferase complex ATPase subunit type 1 TsaE [Anaerolineae bacterium]|nr:tRNA (adenosine(37)-N6)-threonylcarbamoyltransferase complex ATPase subunit type 1 TsaE [Gemmatimonadaceae bacterium]